MVFTILKLPLWNGLQFFFGTFRVPRKRKKLEGPGPERRPRTPKFWNLVDGLMVPRGAREVCPSAIMGTQMRTAPETPRKPQQYGTEGCKGDTAPNIPRDPSFYSCMLKK